MATSGAQPGNQNAKKAKRWQKAIERALARETGQDVDSGLDRAASQLARAAFAGEQWALKELGERIDGKVPQAITGDADEDPIQIGEIIVRGVRAGST